MDDEEVCYGRVSLISAPLMEAFLSGFDRSTEITDEEERRIQRQCSILFSKNSRGVSDPCEAVSLFCSMENFWEKFGVGRGVPIHEMPFKEYIMLKMVIGKESEAMKHSSSPKKPLTRIAGAGGSAAGPGTVDRDSGDLPGGQRARPAPDVRGRL